VALHLWCLSCGSKCVQQAQTFGGYCRKISSRTELQGSCLYGAMALIPNSIARLFRSQTRGKWIVPLIRRINGLQVMWRLFLRRILLHCFPRLLGRRGKGFSLLLEFVLLVLQWDSRIFLLLNPGPYKPLLSGTIIRSKLCWILVKNSNTFLPQGLINIATSDLPIGASRTYTTGTLYLQVAIDDECSSAVISNMWKGRNFESRSQAPVIEYKTAEYLYDKRRYLLLFLCFLYQLNGFTRGRKS
jgi:hypothetical protein